MIGILCHFLIRLLYCYFFMKRRLNLILRFYRLMELRMLIYWNCECWFNITEDAQLMKLRMPFYETDDLIYWYWRFLYNRTEDAYLLECYNRLVDRMLNYWNWECRFVGTEDDGFLVFRMLCNGTEDADLLEVRVLIK